MGSHETKKTDNSTQDLSGHAAVEKIRQIVDDNPNCFFCSSRDTTGQISSRPMNVRRLDNNGAFWFLTAHDSNLWQELQMNKQVTLFFQGAKTSEFMQISGMGELSKDQATIDQLWEPILKTWFTEGSHDPRIRVVKVVPESGYYWDQKHGGLIAGTKMMLGAIMGITMDDSIEGKLSPPQGL